MKSLVIHPKDRSTDFLKPIYAHLRDKVVVTDEKFDNLVTEAEYINKGKLVFEDGSWFDDEEDKDIDWGFEPQSYGKPGRQTPNQYPSVYDGETPYLSSKDMIELWNKMTPEERLKGVGSLKNGGSMKVSGGNWQKKWQKYKKPDDLSKMLPLNNQFDRFLMMGHGSPWGLFSMAHAGMVINDDTARLLRPCSQNVYIWCNADQYVRGNDLRGFFTGMFISEVGEATMMKVEAKQRQVDESNNTFAQIVGKYINEKVAVLYSKVRREYGELAERNPVAEYNWERLYLKM